MLRYLVILCFGFALWSRPISADDIPAAAGKALVKDAIAKQKAGDLKTAVREYREFLKMQPQSAAVRSNLGAALAGLGQFQQAVTEYKTALKESPTLPGAELNLSLAYYKMGRIADAATELVKVPISAPEKAQATLLLADCYLRMGKNKDVIRVLTPVHAARPNDLAVIYLLGTALIRDHQAAKGEVLVNRILSNGNSPEAYMMLGSAKMGAHDFAGARDEFAKAVALDPHLPEAHGLYGQALEATGDPDDAVKQFRAELAVDPYNYEANFQIGALLHQDGKNKAAMPHFLRALNVRPGDLATRYQFALIEIDKDELQQAQRELEAIVKKAPGFRAAHVSLATVYFRTKAVPQNNINYMKCFVRFWSYEYGQPQAGRRLVPEGLGNS
ncbi:MAG: tetratricopeptide repeat protein [Bryobacteraceae bacterium]